MTGSACTGLYRRGFYSGVMLRQLKETQGGLIMDVNLRKNADEIVKASLNAVLPDEAVESWERSTAA